MKTAVEWLGNEIDNELKVIDNLYGKEIIGRKIAFAFVKRILIEAKEMEKEQMFGYIKKNYVNEENSLKFHTEEFENYYNETFKQQSITDDTL
jgi:hypothetical protein